jgi:hypothetical protein
MARIARFFHSEIYEAHPEVGAWLRTHCRPVARSPRKRGEPLRGSRAVMTKEDADHIRRKLVIEIPQALEGQEDLSGSFVPLVFGQRRDLGFDRIEVPTSFREPRRRRPARQSVASLRVWQGFLSMCMTANRSLGAPNKGRRRSLCERGLSSGPQVHGPGHGLMPRL